MTNIFNILIIKAVQVHALDFVFPRCVLDYSQLSSPSSSSTSCPWATRLSLHVMFTVNTALSTAGGYVQLSLIFSYFCVYPLHLSSVVPYVSLRICYPPRADQPLFRPVTSPPGSLFCHYAVSAQPA